MDSGCQGRGLTHVRGRNISLRWVGKLDGRKLIYDVTIQNIANLTIHPYYSYVSLQVVNIRAPFYLALTFVFTHSISVSQRLDAIPMPTWKLD